MKNAESPAQFLHFDLDVNFWAKRLPDTATARPTRCPACQAPGVAADGRVILHGHGLRPRQLRGPAEVGGEPLERKLLVRRYQCQRCHAVVTVGPRGLLPRRLYTAAALALALWLWAVAQRTDPKVRAATCPIPDEGLSRPDRWTTLRRWAKAAQNGQLWRGPVLAKGWTLRQCADRVARWMWSRGDPDTGCDEHRVFTAAAHAG